MKKLIFLLSIVVLFSTTSCLIGDDGSGTTSAQITGKLIVFDEESGSVSYSDDKASITVSIPDYSEPKLDMVFNGVKFADNMPIQVNIKFPGIPFTYTVSEDGNRSNYIFDVTNLTPTISGAPREEYTASRFWGCIGEDVEVRFIIPYKGKTVHFATATSKEK